MMDWLDEARALDAADPLRGARDLFALPPGVTYLDGNSLGPLPKATPDRIAHVMHREWGADLIRSWNPTPHGGDWFTMPRRVGAKIAPLIGAGADEVIACDTVSVNLFKLIAAALQMQGGRNVIVSEPGNFPTDLYMIQGLETQGLARQRLADPDDIVAALDADEDGDVALLLLTHVHYKTGRMRDMAALTAAAQAKGALVLWDLSHSCGAVPVDLTAANVDFAVGCGYKYLNGGPGAPAFAYVAARHHDRLHQPLSGWMGHAAPFAFDDDYRPAPGITRLMAGTPGILGLTALEAGVDLMAGIGMDALVAKSRALSEFFRACMDALCPELRPVGPGDPVERGSQLSYAHEHAYPICQALIARGIIGDFRAPDILRFGLAPAYIGYEDVVRTALALADIMATRAWNQPEFLARAAVT